MDPSSIFTAVKGVCTGVYASIPHHAVHHQPAERVHWCSAIRLGLDARVASDWIWDEERKTRGLDEGGCGGVLGTKEMSRTTIKAKRGRVHGPPECIVCFLCTGLEQKERERERSCSQFRAMRPLKRPMLNVFFCNRGRRTAAAAAAGDVHG